MDMNERLQGREFSLWFYHVSHRRVLLRSPKRNLPELNIDIIFTDVEYINIPTFLGEISISSSRAEGSDDLTFQIATSEKTYTIVAFNCHVLTCATEILHNPLEKDLLETYSVDSITYVI